MNPQKALLAAAAPLCEASFEAVLDPKIGEGAPGAPLITLRDKAWLMAFDEGGGWELYDLPHLTGRYPSEIQTAICASETRAEARTYSDGTPGYQRTWTMRLLSWPDGAVLGEKTLVGEIPAMFVWTSKDATEVNGPDPHFQLMAWKAKLPSGRSLPANG